MYGDESWVQAHLSPANGGTLLKVEHILSRRLFDRLYWSWYGAGATGVGWELWLLGLEQSFWQRKFDALETEIARGKRERRAGKYAEKKITTSRKSG